MLPGLEALMNKTCALIFFSALALAGCGEDKFLCCYNKLFYDCADQPKLDQCASGQTQVCTRDSTQDSTCQ